MSAHGGGTALHGCLSDAAAAGGGVSAVVFDGKFEPRALEPHIDRDDGCPGVFQRIADGFLHDAVDFERRAVGYFLPCSFRRGIDETARLIPEVREITPDLVTAAGGHGSRFSTGGMVTKLHAAQIATDAGIDVIVMNGETPSDIYKALDGKQVGTFFVGKK